MSNFYADVLKKDHRFTSPQCCHDIALLEPVTRAAVAAIISDAAKLGHKLIVTETFRSQARQQYLWMKKLTELKNVGVHNFGLACDFALIQNGQDDPKGEDYMFLRHLAESHGLISGADWGLPSLEHEFRDWDHVQRVAEKDAHDHQTMLLRGNWYPDASYNPLADMGRTQVATLDAPLIWHPGSALVADAQITREE